MLPVSGQPGPLAAVREFLATYVTVSEEELEAAAGALSETRVARGEFFVVAGERPVVFGLVLDGLLRKFYTTESGRELTRGFALKGELVGAYGALLTRSVSVLSVQALEDSRLLTMDFAAIERLYDQYPAWNTLGRRIAEALFIEREQRELELLTLSAAERYDRFRRLHADIAERVPQYQIASYLGITPVSLSRIRARLGRGRTRATK